MNKTLHFILTLIFVNIQIVLAQPYYMNSKFSGSWQNYQLYDDGTNGDVIAGDGVYSADITITTSYPNGIEWYVKDSNFDIIWPVPHSDAKPAWFVTNVDNKIVKFSFDVNNNSEGWIPAQNVGNANDVPLSGDKFYTRIEQNGTWIANQEMNDNGLNGDVTANDGIYACKKVISNSGTYQWWIRRTSNDKFSWGTNGRQKWATNDKLSFTTTNNNQDVYFYLNLNDGRVFYRLDDPLPVELTTFTANVVEGKVNLNWQTATEVNNYGFNIERKYQDPSSKNQVWSKVGFVEGAGNSNSPKNYFYVDNTISEVGKYFYRLKQIDIDGSFEYSKVVEVKILKTLNFKLSQNYPNPFNPTTTIKYTIPSNNFVQLKIYDVLGNEITTLVKRNQTPGTYTVKFDASILPSGVYYYQLKTENNIEVKKMLLLK